MLCRLLAARQTIEGDKSSVSLKRRTTTRCSRWFEQTGVMAAHDDIRQLVALARSVVDGIPERAAAGSPRLAETRSVRASTDGGGVARAQLLGLLNVDMQVMVGHLALIAGGVADDLEIAAQRDNAVNGPALAFVVRPALEVAGQIAWLLSDQIHAARRARRYIIWRFADLRAQRLLLRDFRGSSDETEAAARELDESETEILTLVAAAKWTARPTTHNGGDLQAATLLGVDNKPERMPSLAALVREVSSPDRS